MSDLSQKIKKQKEEVDTNGKKFKRAMKAHEQSTKTGTKKQQENCRLRERTAKNKYLRSVVVLERLKAERKKARAETRRILIEKLNLKKAATVTGASILIVGVAIGYTIYKSNAESEPSEPVADTIGG